MSFRKKIWYESFDKEGFAVKQMYQMAIKIFQEDEDNKGGTTTNSELVYIPEYPNSSLSDNEIAELFVDYIYDTIGVNIESINNLDKFQSLNGLPFLLKLVDVDNLHVYRFRLAFKKIQGSVTLRDDLSIHTLGNIQEIDGDLGLIGVPLKSLGQLTKVTGSFWIAQCFPFTHLTHLDNLESVGKDLYLKGSPIKDLGNLKSVGGTLNLRKTNIESLGSLSYVGNHIYLPKSLKGVFNLSYINIVGKIKYFAN